MTFSCSTVSPPHTLTKKSRLRHPVRRLPALVYPNSGFDHAQHGSRQPITIDPVSLNWIQPGMNYWNDLAGWLLFVHSNNYEIFLEDNDCPYGCCNPRPSFWLDQPYVSAGLWIREDGRMFSEWPTHAHELGHALGLQHQYEARKGVMAGRAGRPKDAKFDKSLLKEAGYA